MKPKELVNGRINRWQPGLKKVNELRIGTWNVLTLYKPGALKTLIEQLKICTADITAIQEVRWLGEGVIEKKECTVFYSCNKHKHQFGTGFVVNNRVKHIIMDFKPLSDRICILRT